MMSVRPLLTRREQPGVNRSLQVGGDAWEQSAQFRGAGKRATLMEGGASAAVVTTMPERAGGSSGRGDLRRAAEARPVLLSRYQKCACREVLAGHREIDW